MSPPAKQVVPALHVIGLASSGPFSILGLQGWCLVGLTGGKPGGDRGPVVGFVLSTVDGGPSVYVSGDTVWYEGIEEVGRRFHIAVALLNLGAATVAAAGPAPLTFTAEDALTLARAWPDTVIVPLHFEGWDHFAEDRPAVASAFRVAGLEPRLRWLTPGVPTTIPLGPAAPQASGPASRGRT